MGDEIAPIRFVIGAVLVRVKGRFELALQLVALRSCLIRTWMTLIPAFMDFPISVA